jgi:hypothetical protein
VRREGSLTGVVIQKAIQGQYREPALKSLIMGILRQPVSVTKPTPRKIKTTPRVSSLGVR